MAYESDIKRQAKLLSDSARNAQHERNRVTSFVDKANQWWKGKGGEAFISEYKSIDSDVSRILRSVDNAVNNMNRLSALIERAERERLEEIVRQAAATKK